MKRFAVVLTVSMMGLAWLLTSVVFPARSVSAVLPAAVPAVPVVVTTPGGLTSVTPSRLLDTSIGVGAAATPVAAYHTVQLQVAGRGGVPASGVSAVVLNVTVTGQTERGFVSVYGDGVERSAASSLNFAVAQRATNLVISPVGANGRVAFYNGSVGAVQLQADVSGYYLSGALRVAGAFGSLAPSRLLDTRVGLGAPQVAVAPSGTVNLQVTGRGGVPVSGVSAVVLNVTVVAPTESGFVRVSHTGTAVSSASNVTFSARETVPNLVFAPVGADGKVALYNGSSGTVQLVADVSGYYLAGPPMVAGAFGSLAPTRLLDTQVGLGAARAPMAAGGEVHLQVTGRGGVPTSGVSAVALNVTVAAPTKPGSVSVTGDGTTLPASQNLTFLADQTVTNLVIAPVAANGKVSLRNGSDGTVQAIAEIAGYYSASDKAATVATGTSHSCEVTSTGGVRCWGFNGHGELGDGTTRSSSVPVSVVGLGSRVRAVSAGLGYTCAVTSAGGVRCWGFNGHGELGDGTTRSSAVPVTVVGLGSGAVVVSAGWTHTCAVTSAGVARCWGENAFGALGDGTTKSSVVPVKVLGLGSGAAAVQSGEFHTCAVTLAGAVRCWGYNGEGELGDGTTKSSAVPVGVAGLGSGVASVSAGRYHSCALTGTGAVRCWGRNPSGQLGNGSTADSAVPVEVLGLGSGTVGVSAGLSHSCAVTKAHKVRCWGGSGGELGAGSAAGSAVPVDVAGLSSGAVAVSAGGHQSCARSAAGAVSCWGSNPNGGLGNGTATSSAVPVDVVGLG
jgi:alpha-tubulin suppressor-like RCC1 family protein